jgi:hypothetical protein
MTMKKHILIFALLTTVCLSAFAQDTEEDEKVIHTKRSSIFHRKDFGLFLGLNNVANANRFPELQNSQSRYTALQWRRNHRLITGNAVDVALGAGWEIAWNNLMFNDNMGVLRQNDGTTVFVDAGRDYEKSKLTVFNLNVPLMLQFGIKESNWRLGLGGYAGVRLGSYTKTKDYENGTNRVHGAYNLSKFRYGFAAEMGRNDFAVFVRYDMTPMFNNTNSVNGNIVSFGVRL